MVAEFASNVVDFSSTPSVSLQAIELEEAILGAILLDPGIFAQVKGLSIQAFSISTHQEIFKVMLDLHSSGLQPDLPTVAFRMAEQGTLKSIGGQTKLASLLDRTVHSVNTEQYASLLQQKYYRRCLSDRISSIARLAVTEKDLGSAIQQAQQQLEKIKTVSGDTLGSGDIQTLDPVKLRTTVTSVTQILDKGLTDWEEQAYLDEIQSTSGISKAAFAHLVASLRCSRDEVLPDDKQQLHQLIEWKNVKLDFKSVLPDLAEDLLHDARVLNIDPIMLWQYLLPTTLSLVGKKVDLDVSSHKVPAIAWTCCVGESGIGKSRAEGLILSPLRAWQEAEYHRFKTQWVEYKQLQNQKKDEQSEQATAPLPERKFLFEVGTIQAVMKRLSEQGENGSLWARDEIAGLFKSLGQFTAKGEGEGLECLLPMWDGSSAPVDRVLHEDSYYLACSRLSIAGGLQPGVFRKIFQDPDDAQGLQARFLFALPKVQPAKRVKGYCRLSDKLPLFYRWVDEQFPTGTVKLATAADARYDAVYEQIGQQAELADTPAIRAWMRKLPGQLLRIALALHIIECYHQPNRPRHELQLDTLNRAIDFCCYYRSSFQLVQHSVSDSDSISAILLKIWDLAATSPSGLAVRDAYRHIKALSRRAQEQGRKVSAYTLDLYYQLEKMGKGVVDKSGRVVRFIAGSNNTVGCSNDSATTTTSSSDTHVVTAVTVPETTGNQGLLVSSQDQVSPVTQLNTDNTQLLNPVQLQAWVERIAAVRQADDCMSCLEALNQLPDPVVEQIWTAASQFLDYFWQLAASELAYEAEQLDKAPVVESIDTTDIKTQISTADTSISQQQEAIASPPNHQFTNSTAEIVSDATISAIGSSTNSPQTAPTPPTLQELAAVILECATWVELATKVGNSGKKLVQAATQMTQEQKTWISDLLKNYLCSAPSALSQIAWVPEKLRERVLKQLNFTIGQLNSNHSIEVGLESISGCRYVSVQHIGTNNECWVFQTSEGRNIPVFGTQTIEAIAAI